MPKKQFKAESKRLLDLMINSIYPHKGDWREAGTVKQAYLFNNTLMAAVKKGSDRTLPPQYSLVSADADTIVIEVVKQAEDSRDVILRMYECFNQRTDTRTPRSSSCSYNPNVSIRNRPYCAGERLNGSRRPSIGSMQGMN